SQRINTFASTAATVVNSSPSSPRGHIPTTNFLLKEPSMPNQVVWFDLPATDLDRALRFYSAVLGVQVKKEQHGNVPIGVLPHADTDVAGCIFIGKDAHPSPNGPL